ncbi:carbon monoxide dehydrogenase subunit G [Spirillospora sp. NPDC127200]
MKVTGSADVAAPRARVWDALLDADVLSRAIPGCRSLDPAGLNAYDMRVSAGVASIKGVYSGRVELSDLAPPQAFTLRARGQGAPGSVDATVRVRLGENGEGTRVDYEADAVVGGMVGGVGQRLLGSVAKKTAGEFFTAVERELTAPPPMRKPDEDAVEGARPRWPDRSSKALHFVSPAPVAPIGAFAMGAAVALAGVALGYALGRRR